MKKLLNGLFTLILTICFIGTAMACDNPNCKCKDCKCDSQKEVLQGCSLNTIITKDDFEGIYNGYQVVYQPTTKTWSTGSLADNKIVLTKKTSDGSGNYSEYYSGNKKYTLALKSNFEFIKDGRFIGVDNAGLKYYEITYNQESDKFVETPLCPLGLKKIFPNTKIIKISKFNNNELIIKKRLFKKKQILLFNDTNNYFHKYTFSPSNVQTTDIKGLITINHLGKIKFSLYGDKENMLVIKVKKGKCTQACSCKKECTCGENCKCGKDCKCDTKCTCGDNCKCKK